MRVIKPKALRKGDLIGVVSPASSPDDMSRIEKGINYLEKLGYKVKPGKYINKNHGYLSALDEERASDINDMFANKDVRAIFCVRGGYGTPRILNRINYDLIKRNPKIFVGYSDITALQLAIFKKTGLITFSGPMLATDMYSFDTFAEENFWMMITSNSKSIDIKNPEGNSINILRKGRKARGRLLGGNLSLICAIIGTPFQPDFKDAILLIEEIGEEPYRIDRYLSHLKNSKILSNVKAILLGQFIDCVPEKPDKSLTLDEIFEDYFTNLKIPVISNLSYGHIREKLTLPIGAMISVDAEGRRITISEQILL